MRSKNLGQEIGWKWQLVMLLATRPWALKHHLIQFSYAMVEKLLLFCCHMLRQTSVALIVRVSTSHTFFWPLADALRITTKQTRKKEEEFDFTKNNKWMRKSDAIKCRSNRNNWNHWTGGVDAGIMFDTLATYWVADFLLLTLFLFFLPLAWHRWLLDCYVVATVECLE